MPDPIRVLIVDDSVVVRRAVSDALASDSEISVVGSAADGKIAIEQISQLRPEVLVLDIEMPESNGFDVLRAIRKDYPRIKTIMFSTLTQRGAVQTIEALSLGASDYVAKPSSIGQTGYGDMLKRVAAELIPKIKQFRSNGAGASLSPKTATTSGSPQMHKLNGIPKIVAIGISTGGPEALSRFLPKLSKEFPVPLVIVQHMPPLFTQLLAERLNLSSGIKVVEGSEGAAVEPGVAYIAPGDYHMALKQREGKVFLSLNQAPPENSCRPAADVLFRSVAEVYGPNALGVIMTGMGQDGLQGLKAMRGKGAVVFAQDQATSVVWGMPAAVVREGLADSVIPLDQMYASVEAYVSKKPIQIV